MTARILLQFSYLSHCYMLWNEINILTSISIKIGIVLIFACHNVIGYY